MPRDWNTTGSPSAQSSDDRRVVSLGHGTVCSDTLHDLLDCTVEDYLRVHHPLSSSDVRHIGSKDLWYLHRKFRDLIQDRYTTSFAIFDGLADAEFVATHDSWVLINMVLNKRLNGRQAEPPPNASFKASTGFRDRHVVQRDFESGTPALGQGAFKICLENIYDLHDYANRESAHLECLEDRRGGRGRSMSQLCLSSDCRTGEVGIQVPSARESRPSRTHRRVVKESGDCLLGCNGRCKWLCEPGVQGNDVAVETSQNVMSGALSAKPAASPAVLRPGSQVLLDSKGNTHDQDGDLFVFDGDQGPPPPPKSDLTDTQAELAAAQKLGSATCSEEGEEEESQSLNKRFGMVALACRKLLRAGWPRSPSPEPAG